MSHAGSQRRCIKIRRVMDSRLGAQLNAVKSRMTQMHSPEFLHIRRSACLINVSRVHVGPVNGSLNMMKHPLRRGKW